jgi:isocitrate/isopropylmalate dehydrogenase
MFLSAAMMLEWLGGHHDVNACKRAGRELTKAVERAFATGTLFPVEFGGTADTQAVFRRVHEELMRLPVAADATA